MRIFPTVLLAAAFLNRIANSSRPKERILNLPDTDRTRVDGFDVPADDRAVWEDDGSNREERMLRDPLDRIIATKTAKSIMGEFYKSTFSAKRLHDHGLTKDGFGLLTLFDDNHVNQYIKALPIVEIRRYLAAHNKDKALRHLIRGAQASPQGGKHFLETMFNLNNQRKMKDVQYHLSYKEYNSMKQAKKLKTAYNERLRKLQEFVAIYVADKPRAYDQLEDVSKAFGGWAKLATDVSIATKSQIIGHNAKELQTMMFRTWLDNGKSIDDVVEMLELSMLSKKCLTYENMDTFVQYIARYNKKHPGANQDAITYLRKKFGDGKLTAMVVEGKKLSNYATWIESALFKRWNDEGDDSAGYYYILLVENFGFGEAEKIFARLRRGYK